jgi:hypothetical protein
MSTITSSQGSGNRTKMKMLLEIGERTRDWSGTGSSEYGQ